MSFVTGDIRSDMPFLDAELSVSVGDEKFRFSRLQWRESFAADTEGNVDALRRAILDSERLGDRRRNLLRELDASHGVSDTDFFAPSKAELKSAIDAAGATPNCVFFSTNRSVVSHAKARARTSGGAAAAFADALVPRPLHVAQFAEWMRVQEALAKERPLADRHLGVLRDAVYAFLPGYENLGLAEITPVVFGKPTTMKMPRLRFDHGGTTLEIDQLSDGERGVLALVLDLARRLSQANPSVDDPLKDGEAIADWWERQMPIRDRASRDRLVRRKRSKYIEGDGNLQEYCQVVVHWLDKSLAGTTL